MITLQCTIISSHFVDSSIYQIAWGDEIYARIAASNSLGISEYSDTGSGAIILSAPDAPINLQNWVAVTSSVAIGI